MCHSGPMPSTSQIWLLLQYLEDQIATFYTTSEIHFISADINLLEH